MKRTKADHVVVGEPQDTNLGKMIRTTCKHCGAIWDCKLPINVSEWAKRGKRFIAFHRDCPKPEGSRP